MTSVTAEDFGSWRTAARNLLIHDVAPDQVLWSPGLFTEPVDGCPASITASVPKEFLDAAKVAAMHRDPHRWALLYRILYRITHGERNLLKIDIDDDVRALTLMQKAVGRDIHKMRAFVRFRRVAGSDPEQFVAWHKPDHYITETNAPWFAARFAAMRWSILTPDRSVHWNLEELQFGP